MNLSSLSTHIQFKRYQKNQNFGRYHFKILIIFFLIVKIPLNIIKLLEVKFCLQLFDLVYMNYSSLYIFRHIQFTGTKRKLIW